MSSGRHVPGLPCILHQTHTLPEMIQFNSSEHQFYSKLIFSFSLHLQLIKLTSHTDYSPHVVSALAVIAHLCFQIQREESPNHWSPSSCVRENVKSTCGLCISQTRLLPLLEAVRFTFCQLSFFSLFQFIIQDKCNSCLFDTVTLWLVSAVKTLGDVMNVDYGLSVSTWQQNTWRSLSETLEAKAPGVTAENTQIKLE